MDREPEEAALQRLMASIGRPAPDRSRLREWAAAQSEAIQAHLAAYPESKHALRLYHWLLINEIQVLGRFERAEKALDSLDAVIRKSEGPGVQAAAERALRLRVQLYARWGREDHEAAAIRELLPRLGDVERRLMEGRLYELGSLRPGCPLPPVRGRDLDGHAVEPSTWAGKVLLLDFWDLGGEAVVEDFAERAAALESGENHSLVIVGVPLARSEADVRAFLAERRARWPQVFDPARPGNDHPLARRFSPTGRPTSFLVDRRGVIRHRDLRGPALRLAIETLQRESAPKPR